MDFVPGMDQGHSTAFITPSQHCHSLHNCSQSTSLASRERESKVQPSGPSLSFRLCGAPMHLPNNIFVYLPLVNMVCATHSMVNLWGLERRDCRHISSSEWKEGCSLGLRSISVD